MSSSTLFIKTSPLISCTASRVYNINNQIFTDLNISTFCKGSLQLIIFVRFQNKIQWPINHLGIQINFDQGIKLYLLHLNRKLLCKTFNIPFQEWLSLSLFAYLVPPYLPLYKGSLAQTSLIWSNPYCTISARATYLL